MTVNVFGTELFMSGVADVLGLQDQLPGKLALNAQIVIVDVGIADAFGKNDSR